MPVTDSEWKDWAWIKTQWRDRRPIWISAAVGFVLGCVPVVPVWISFGGTK